MVGKESGTGESGGQAGAEKTRTGRGGWQGRREKATVLGAGGMEGGRKEGSVGGKGRQEWKHGERQAAMGRGRQG